MKLETVNACGGSANEGEGNSEGLHGRKLRVCVRRWHVISFLIRRGHSLAAVEESQLSLSLSKVDLGDHRVALSVWLVVLGYYSVSCDSLPNMRIGLGMVAAHCCGILALLTVSTHGYIPAQATNNSELVNVTDSQISLSWSDGTYAVPVSFQLTGSGSVGYSKVSLLQLRS